MNWELATAKNGEATLKLNGVQLYSRYRPREDAWKWIDAEFDSSKTSYLLIGLGLGYHAERLINLAEKKPVYVYYFDQNEFEWSPISQAVSTIIHLDFSDCQILIPNVWIRAIGSHPLLPFLEDIKINQVSYKKFGTIMSKNFEENLLYWSQQRGYPKYTQKVACLVASGPSLNETIHWLKGLNDQVAIFVVGSALKMVLAHGVIPTAVIISDAQLNIVKQIEGTNYTGDLYFLSTANEQAVKKHIGTSYIIFQQGYMNAEKAAVTYNMPLIESGGSVSTTTISLIEYLGFEKIMLFGQDLGFSGKRTHAQLSTSGSEVLQDLNSRTVIANDGSEIQTTPNLQVYARWIEKKAERMKATIYTTALKGMRLAGVKQIDYTQFKKISET